MNSEDVQDYERQCDSKLNQESRMIMMMYERERNFFIIHTSSFIILIMVLPILTGADNPMLRAKAKNVGDINKELKSLVKDMEETMTKADGVGLAAPQVGKSIRLCIARIEDTVTILINPVITKRSDKKVIDQEGCLSLPGVWVDVARACDIQLTYSDLKGKTQERQLSGFSARVVQHEIDHLNGILTVDHANVTMQPTTTQPTES